MFQMAINGSMFGGCFQIIRPSRMEHFLSPTLWGGRFSSFWRNVSQFKTCVNFSPLSAFRKRFITVACFALRWHRFFCLIEVWYHLL